MVPRPTPPGDCSTPDGGAKVSITSLIRRATDLRNTPGFHPITFWTKTWLKIFTETTLTSLEVCQELDLEEGVLSCFAHFPQLLVFMFHPGMPIVKTLIKIRVFSCLHNVFQQVKHNHTSLNSNDMVFKKIWDKWWVFWLVRLFTGNFSYDGCQQRTAHATDWPDPHLSRCLQTKNWSTCGTVVGGLHS